MGVLSRQLHQTIHPIKTKASIADCQLRQLDAETSDHPRRTYFEEFARQGGNNRNQTTAQDFLTIASTSINRSRHLAASDERHHRNQKHMVIKDKDANFREQDQGVTIEFLTHRLSRLVRQHDRSVAKLLTRGLWEKEPHGDGHGERQKDGEDPLENKSKFAANKANDNRNREQDGFVVHQESRHFTDQSHGVEISGFEGLEDELVHAVHKEQSQKGVYRGSDFGADRVGGGYHR